MANNILDDLEALNEPQGHQEKPSKRDEKLELLKLKNVHFLSIGIGILLFFIISYYVASSWFLVENKNENWVFRTLSYTGLMIAAYMLVVQKLMFLYLPLDNSKQEKKGLWRFFSALIGNLVLASGVVLYSVVIIFMSMGAITIVLLIFYLLGIGTGSESMGFSYLSFFLAFLIDLISCTMILYKDLKSIIKHYHSNK